MVKEITELEFKEITKEGKVLVDCYAPWCGPCKMLSPIIDEVASEVNTCTFYKLNVDDAPNVSEEYGIVSIPTILLFENGELKDKIVGFRSKDELLELVK